MYRHRGRNGPARRAARRRRYRTGGTITPGRVARVFGIPVGLLLPAPASVARATPGGIIVTINGTIDPARFAAAMLKSLGVPAPIGLVVPHTPMDPSEDIAFDAPVP